MTDEPTSTDTVAIEDDTTNLVPAHVIAQKRRQRDERRNLLAKTIAVQALDEQEPAVAP